MSMIKKGSKNIEYLLLAVFLSLLMLTYGNKIANDFGATGYITGDSPDSDSDGVPDVVDRCVGTLLETPTDIYGCPCEEGTGPGTGSECVSLGSRNPEEEQAVNYQSGLNFKAPFSFVVYGDSRTGNDIHTNIVSKIVKENPGFVVNTGDIVGDGTSWDEFLNIVNSIKDKYYVAIGNHEYDDGGGDGNFFETMRSLPKMDEHAKMNANPSTYFSTQEENIYLIVLNRAGDEDGNTHNLDGDKDQQNWLEEELKKANQLKKDGKIDFIFVFLHKPF